MRSTRFWLEAVRILLWGVIALSVLFLFLLVWPSEAKASETYSGPYEAEVMRVVDADTIEVRAAIWPGLTVDVAVRLDDIDTPESWRPKCQTEKAMARRATRFVETRVAVGDVLLLTDVSLGKFAGRVVGTLSKDGRGGPRSIGEALIENGLAVPYDGGTRRDWCAAGSSP